MLPQFYISIFLLFLFSYKEAMWLTHSFCCVIHNLKSHRSWNVFRLVILTYATMNLVTYEKIISQKDVWNCGQVMKTMSGCNCEVRYMYTNFIVLLSFVNNLTMIEHLCLNRSTRRTLTYCISLLHHAYGHCNVGGSYKYLYPPLISYMDSSEDSLRTTELNRPLVTNSLNVRKHFNSSCGKVMFSQASVILSTGGCLADTPLGRQAPPPGQTSPPPGRHPPGRHLPQETANAADGTHPTGMHSCYH